VVGFIQELSHAQIHNLIIKTFHRFYGIFAHHSLNVLYLATLNDIHKLPVILVFVALLLLILVDDELVLVVGVLRKKDV
jgi:hypothetical protein